MRALKFFAAVVLLLGCQKPVSGVASDQASLVSNPSLPVVASNRVAPQRENSSKRVLRTSATSKPVTTSSSAAFVDSPAAKPSESQTNSSAVTLSSEVSVDSGQDLSVQASVSSASSASNAITTEADLSQASSMQFARNEGAVDSSVEPDAAANVSEDSGFSSSSEQPAEVGELNHSAQSSINMSIADGHNADSSASIATFNESTSVESASPASERKQEIPLDVVGKVTIDFVTRDPDVKDRTAVDRYSVDLTVARALRIHGFISRKPRVVTAILGREKSPLEMIFELGLELIHPQSGERLDAGRITGTVPVSQEGLYSLGASKSGLALKTKVRPEGGGLGGAFAGRIQGKSGDESEGLLRTYTRWIGKRKVSYRAAHTDPLEFKNVILAAGPIEMYPETSVSGRLDYDYDTGNWLTDGIVMRFQNRGEMVSDKITGTIRWEEDPNRARNGRGTYTFNLRFNDKGEKRDGDERDFFASASDEEAFFVVDDTVPTLTGTVAYVDRMLPGGDPESPTVLASQIKYDLLGKGLTKQQLVNFVKLWLLLSGPVNDE